MGIAVAVGVIVTLVTAFVGISMAMAKHLVELHGGAITAHSACTGRGRSSSSGSPVAVSPAPWPASD